MEGYLKQFVAWAKLKIRLHLKPDRETVYFNEREVWWASLGVNIGYEENGKHDNFERPVLVLKKFNQYILWALPMTSKIRVGKYYFKIKYDGENYAIILSQLRVISSKRLLRKIRMLPDNQFNDLRGRLKKLI